MVDVLASSPLLTMMVVVAAGTLIGAIPFGPLRFGPAGALFVGLGIGALDPRLGEGLGLVQTLGLALFVYTVGIAAGAGFFRDLRRQLPLMAGAALVLAVLAGLTVVVGEALHLTPALRAGTFSGALTSTPALAAATEVAGTDEPAVGYSLAYPVGVVLTIVVMAVVLSRPWTARRDPDSTAGLGLVDISVEVERPGRLSEVPGVATEAVRLSYLARGGRMRVVAPDEDLQVGDRVVVVGPEAAVRRARDHLGRRVDEHLAHDRREVDYRRFLVSDPRLAGRTIGELDVPGRFGGIVTRVRRGDLDMLASDDSTLELGDRVRVIVPRGRMREVSRLFGDSERRVSEVDALSLGVGLAVGLAVGLVALPLPGGLTFALGSAAGPLVVGMLLGRLERTGPLVWVLPLPANLTIRQLGLLLFLGATGLASGQAFADQALTGTGLRVVLAAAVLSVAGGVLFVVAARLVGVSTARAAGGLAGFVGQPAILAYANGRLTDERIESGYAALFALGIILKILLVQVIAG
ncbi:aspartate:alanine exchanger family transporter [Ornithinimicrobium cavernae]|uniref:aspartate:alanine exchanger family transporter n=1 Tax=Ornithinimicrobium cavernae TaxID=2666047 RepID=UPI000D696961|nr:TrkA C-terminal domain-containing protein [Ornithinimicrobium cavernae]